MAIPESKPKCFIVMPISTPEAYSDDPHHFKHILECLFTPAVEKAGMQPISPVAQGADLIHAEIVHHLESDEFVLCDMATLNANVFFELGIRTAVGKPLCLVKDEKPLKVPFDLAPINYHIYCGSLKAWQINEEIEKLAKHLKESFERSNGGNMLWKYYSMKQQAQLSHPTPADESRERLEMLSMQVETLTRKIADNSYQPSVEEQNRLLAESAFRSILNKFGCTFNEGPSLVTGMGTCFYVNTGDKVIRKKIKEAAENLGCILSM